MSTLELPEDSSNWPTDPFALLGVQRGVGETEIRRAYTRLIRRFKPERFPEQFQLIRDAYDKCLQQFSWFIRPEEPTAPDIPPSAPKVVDPSTSNAPQDHSLPELRMIFPTPEVDQVDRCWSMAAEGKDEVVYIPLIILSATQPERADIALRLYWLLALNPGLDTDRTRHDWLAIALTRSGLSGPAAELYRRELAIDPDIALKGPYINLLTSRANPNDLLTIARWRLDAAGRSRSWDQDRSWRAVQFDLEALSTSVPMHNEAGWLGYVVATLDWLVWDRPQPVLSIVRRELARLRHLELSHSYAFDRVEETDRISSGWPGMENCVLPRVLARLIPIAWAGSGIVTAVEVDAAIATITEDRGRGLYLLDRFVKQSGKPQLMLLAKLLDGYRLMRDPAEEEFPPDLIRGLAANAGVSWGQLYRELREPLLNFLIAEVIHPEEFAEASRLSPESSIREVARKVREDLSLRIVWLAERLQQG